MALPQPKRVSATSYATNPVSVVQKDGAMFGSPINDVYDSAEFNLVTGQTDYDVESGQSIFSNGNIKGKATYVSIRTNNTITVKFNATTNDSITIASSDSPYIVDTLEVTNIYITNASGSTAAIKIFLT